MDRIVQHKASSTSYLLRRERLLVEKVKLGDRAGAREILNQLLGAIMFDNPGDLAVLKVRVIELLSVLSRAAVEGGAQADLLLRRNQGYIRTVLDFQNAEELCAWIAGPLEEFIEYVYSTRTRNSGSHVWRVIQYMETHYAEPLTVENIGRAVALSPSHITHLFRQEVETSPNAYLNNLRIEKAKEVLLNSPQAVKEIAQECGFRYMPYFTRTFKRITGLTPSQFRRRQKQD